MSKHTPGPWQVGPVDVGSRVIELYDGGPTVASTWLMGDDFNDQDAPERDANARLIAKAPELATALRELRAAAEDMLISFGNPNTRESLNYKDRAYEALALLADL